jgi:hypothetical protein
MKHMIPLRVVALFSNVTFLTYGIGMHLMPVVLLHSALVPINLYRLILAVRDDGVSGTAAAPTFHSHGL